MPEGRSPDPGSGRTRSTRPQIAEPGGAGPGRARAAHGLGIGRHPPSLLMPEPEPPEAPAAAPRSRPAADSSGRRGPAVPVSSSILCPSTFIAAPGAARLGAAASGERSAGGEEPGGRRARSGAEQPPEPEALSPPPALPPALRRAPPSKRFKESTNCTTAHPYKAPAATWSG